MGSYCALLFDKWEVIYAKSVVPDELCALFQESDRRAKRSKIRYLAPREVILDRLNILGCTPAASQERFEAWLARKRAELSSELSPDPDSAAVETFTFNQWRRRVPRLLATRWRNVRPRDAIERQMREEYGGWLWFDGLGSLLNLRALLDACPRIKTVGLDISELVGGGWIEPGEAICELRRIALATPRPLAPTVLLAEGSSDIRVLQHSLKALYPEVTEYFSFFNHADLRVDGGANFLVKFLKAFAAARTPLRIVAVFDNDAIGAVASKQAEDLNLPNNFAILRLPDTELAKDYPTVGPQGRHRMDVNGKAASLELYLGRAALTRGHELRPVRWTGFVQEAHAYQGEVEEKNKIVEAFIEGLGGHNSLSARSAYPELVNVWRAIFRSGSICAEHAQRSSPPPFEW